MTIKKSSKCGTMESNDIFIVFEPNHNGKIEIELESIVEKQFGGHIRQLIKNKLLELGINSIKIHAKDRGALDYTIIARIECGVKRGEI